MLLVVCRPLPPGHLIPTEKPFLFCSPGGMLRGSATTGRHWVVQGTKQHPFLILLAMVVVTLMFISF